MMRYLLPASLALLVGCWTSPAPSGFPPARSPGGVQARLQTQSGTQLSGELLEVRDSAYVVLLSNRVTIVPFLSLRGAAFPHQDWGQLGSYTHPSADTRDRIRWYSRFPFGMNDVALAALLRASGQTTPDVVASAP